jgi:hypothetical protein
MGIPIDPTSLSKMPENMRRQILASMEQEARRAVLTPIKKEDVIGEKRRPSGKSNANAPIQVADVERSAGNESVGTQEGSRFHQRVRIHVHSRRKRLCDPDGVSAKSVIDGLVQGGVLQDDSTKCVSEIRFTQEKSEEDETEITILLEEKNGRI